MFYKCLKVVVAAGLLFSFSAQANNTIDGDGEDFPFKCSPHNSVDKQHLIVWKSDKSSTGLYGIMGESREVHTPKFEVHIMYKENDLYGVRGHWELDNLAGAVVAKVNLETGESNLKHGSWSVERNRHPRRIMHSRPWSSILCKSKSSHH
jgi:hypothetical protein